jgi:hypothetical protein
VGGVRNVFKIAMAGNRLQLAKYVNKNEKEIICFIDFVVQPLIYQCDIPFGVLLLEVVVIQQQSFHVFKLKHNDICV